MVAAQPKSGSTFVCNVLAEILKIPVEKYSKKSVDDFNFNENQAESLRETDAVIHIHSKPTDAFIAWLQENDYPTIVLTREFEGFSISMRDHIMRGQNTVVREFMKKMNKSDQVEFVKR